MSFGGAIGFAWCCGSKGLAVSADDEDVRCSRCTVRSDLLEFGNKNVSQPRMVLMNGKDGKGIFEQGPWPRIWKDLFGKVFEERKEMCF